MQKKLGQRSLPTDGARPGGRTRYMETTKIEAPITYVADHPEEGEDT